MGLCGTTLFPFVWLLVWPLVGSLPGTTGLEWAGTGVCSQAFPLEPSLQMQSWGLRHIPPFWHGGKQLAALQKETEQKQRERERTRLSQDGRRLSTENYKIQNTFTTILYNLYKCTALLSADKTRLIVHKTKCLHQTFWKWRYIQTN